MTEELCDLIEDLNRERIELLNSPQYIWGRRVLNIKVAIKEFKLHKLIALWIRGRKDKKISNERIKSDYRYGEYPDRALSFCVYTCVTGGYDRLQTVHCHPENVEYIAFTDNLDLEAKGWTVKPLPDAVKEIAGDADRNRYLKMHPSIVGAFDYTIYVDGVVEIFSDVTNMINVLNPQYGLAIHIHPDKNCIYNEVDWCKRNHRGNVGRMDDLLKEYNEEGFPRHYGLLECPVILSHLHNEQGLDILDEWWKEHIKRGTGRDQITLPYVLWKKGITVEEIGTLGNDVKANPKFRFHAHRNYPVINSFLDLPQY